MADSNKQNTKTPKIVVISPVRNEERLLPGTIESMVAQTLQPTEWIIVDDGSTDETSEAARPFQPIKILRHDQKMGYGASLADGIRATQYDTIAILDGDTTYPPEFIPDLLAEKVDMAIGHRKKIMPPSYNGTTTTT